MSHYNLFAADESGERPNAHEAEAYHDMLEEMINDDDFWRLQENGVRQAMLVVRDCFCWALGHENDALAHHLLKWTDEWREYKGHGQRFDN